MPKPSRRHMVMAVLLLGSVGFLFYSLHSVGLPRSGAARDTTGEGTSPEQTSASDASLMPAAPGDVDYERYRALAQRSVFSERGRVKTPPKKPEKLPEPPPFDKPDHEESRSTMPDFTGWSYVGYVVIDGTKFGIVQNESNQSCECLPEGKSFLGAEVGEVARQSIEFKSGSRRSTLSRIRDFPVAPLDKGATAAGGRQGARRR